MSKELPSKNEEITAEQKDEFKLAVERFEPFFEDDTDDQDDFIRSVTFEEGNKKIVIYTCIDKPTQNMDWRVTVEEHTGDSEGEKTVEESYILQQKTGVDETEASYEREAFYKPQGHSDPDVQESNFDQPFTFVEFSAVMDLLQNIDPEKVQAERRR